MKKIIWFMILSSRYENNPKPTVWKGSENLTSLKKVSVDGFHSDIRKYFLQNWENDLF